MIKVMFWNINRKSSFENVICDVIKNEKIDILLLAEAMNVDDSIISTTSLIRKNSSIKSDQINLTPRFYSNDRGFTLDHYYTYPNTKRMVFCFLDIPNKSPILLCGLHLRSKLMRDSYTQIAEATVHSSEIRAIEDSGKRTIVFGDFNVNPFELGMISPIGFNATLSKTESLKGVRSFIKDDYDFFYNPMWNFLGDLDDTGNAKLPGSFYFNNNDSATITYWNVLDNLLIRPNLIPEIDLEYIKILESSGSHNFVNIVSDEYQIDKPNYSDHLPLIFKIKL